MPVATIPVDPVALSPKQKIYVEYLLDGHAPVKAAEKAYPDSTNPSEMVHHNKTQPNVLSYLRHCLNKSQNTTLEGTASKLSQCMEAKKVLNDGSESLAPDTTNQLRATELVLKLQGALSDSDGSKTVNNTQFNVVATIGSDLEGLLGKMDTMQGHLFGDGMQVGDNVEQQFTQPIDI